MNIPIGKMKGCETGYFTIAKKTDVQDIIPSLHTHDYIEFCYFERGSGTYTIDGDSFLIKNGDLVIINAKVKHSFSTNSNELSIFNILFTPDFVDESLNNFDDFYLFSQSNYFKDFWDSNIGHANIHIATLVHDDINSIFIKLFDEYYQNFTGSALLTRVYMIELIAKIVRILDESENAGIHEKNNEAVSDVIAYLHEHYRDHITLDIITENISYSKSHLCKIFKNMTGKTIYEYLNELRINEACKLLHYTNRSLTDISISVGFADYKYFSKNFLLFTGKKPSEYRIVYPSQKGC